MNVYRSRLIPLSIWRVLTRLPSSPQQKSKFGKNLLIERVNCVTEYQKGWYLNFLVWIKMTPLVWTYTNIHMSLRRAFIKVNANNVKLVAKLCNIQYVIINVPTTKQHYYPVLCTPPICSSYLPFTQKISKIYEFSHLLVADAL